MHGPSATPLIVELATVAILLVGALTRKPLARGVKWAAARTTSHRRQPATAR